MEESVESLVLIYGVEIINTINVCVNKTRVKNSYIPLFHNKVIVYCLLNKKIASEILEYILSLDFIHRELEPYVDILYILCGYQNKNDFEEIAEKFLMLSNFLGLQLMNSFMNRLKTTSLTKTEV